MAWLMITPRHCPKRPAPEIVRQIEPLNVPRAGVYAGKVPVQQWQTAHAALLLPPLRRALLLGLVVLPCPSATEA